MSDEPRQPDAAPPRRRLLDAPTLAALSVLLLGAAAVYVPPLAAGWHVVKTPAPIRRHFFRFPETLTPWHKVGQRELSKEVIDELGTHEYLFWILRRTGASDGSVTALLAYHTGAPDARPYVSPRCQVANGIEAEAPVERTLVVPLRTGAGITSAAESAAVPVRLFPVPREPGVSGRDAVGGGDGWVVYTHIANGRPIADPQAVSDALFDPATPHAWYCRVEMLIADADSAETAAQVATSVLASLLPPMMDHLPAEPPSTLGRTDSTDPATAAP